MRLHSSFFKFASHGSRDITFQCHTHKHSIVLAHLFFSLFFRTAAHVEIASYPVLFLDSPPERGEEKRAWYTLTAHVQDLHPFGLTDVQEVH